MELANRWQDRNLPKLESVIAWTIILIIMAVFLRYMLVVFARAEMSSINSTVLNINSAVQYHAAMAVLKGNFQALTQLTAINPFEQIQDIRAEYIENQINETMKIFPETVPFLIRRSGYLGEFSNPDLNVLKTGSWFFDRKDNTLVYLVRNDEFFDTELQGNARVRFKFNIEYEDNDGNHRYDPGLDRFLNIQLSNIDDYHWVF